MRHEWRLRGRLVAVVALSATAPTIAIAYWVVAWLTSGMPLAHAVIAVVAWIGAVAGAASVFGRFAANRLVGPLEELTGELYRFDPVAGDIGIEALTRALCARFDLQRVRSALAAAGIDGRRRAEVLDVESYVALARALELA